MAGKRTGRARGGAAGRSGETAAGREVVKVTLRLSLDTSRRLGVESVMSGRSQSEIAEGLLAAYLKRWRLPSTIESPVAGPAGPADEAV